MATARTHARNTRAPDAVQRRLVGFDRVIALIVLTYVSLNATHLTGATQLVTIGTLVAIFVLVIFYADYRYQGSGRK